MTTQDDERRHAEEVAREWLAPDPGHNQYCDIVINPGYGKCDMGCDPARGPVKPSLADLIQRERALAHDAALEKAAEVAWDVDPVELCGYYGGCDVAKTRNAFAEAIRSLKLVRP